uniref:Replication protein A 32 kDa subunit n=1 Tax=Kalanchoe fedtschenkoi TaxID=63787 RepID=A0A7N0URV0_KALFE
MFSSQFEPSTGGFSMSQSPSQATESPAKVRDGNPGLVPVTVKQMSEATESGSEKSVFAINGVDINNVTLVGVFQNKSMRNTDVSFSLDDGTGQIDCKRWMNDAYETKEMEGIDDDMYVRVVGHLKSFQGTKSLAVLSVRPVTNYDEVTFHFLDCIRTHLLHSTPQAKLQVGNLASDSSQSTPVRNASNGLNSITSNQPPVTHIVDGIKGNDQLVLDFLQQPSNFEIEKGTHRDEIARSLKLPVNKVIDSLRSLEEEGLIYSTIDEFHYKSTSGI